MKKIRKTKEERKEIRKFKEEEKNKLRLNKEKKPFMKEHLYLIIAILVLALLITILIYMLFFSKSRDVIVPDLPKNETMDIGLIDFNDKGTTADDLNSKKNNNISVNYKVVSDYYKEGILLSNTNVEYLNNTFIVTSGPLSKDPFISKLSKDGNLEWLTKLNDKEYGTINVYKTVFINNNYYVFATSTKDSKLSLISIKINDSGKKVTTSKLKDDFNGKIKDVVISDKKISIITGDSSDIKVYFTDEDLKVNKNEVVISKYVDNSTYLNYQKSISTNGLLNVVVNNTDKFYSVEIDTNSYSTTAKEFNDINELKYEGSLKVSNYLDGYTGYTDTDVYKFDKNNKLINKIDYSKIKLENDEEFKKKYKDDEFFPSDDLENFIEIEEIKNDENRLVVKSNTLYSTIYDIYDSSLKINKRIMLDKIKYTYNESILLNSFYIDGTIYELYSYGSVTPSIMISKIG